MTRCPTQRLLRAAPWLALLLFTAAVSFQKIRTFDYWWHLRTGRLIAETGSVPRVDPYTYTVPGARWVDVHWLHQLGLHGLYVSGGHGAVVAAKWALVLVWVAVLARIGCRRDRPAVSVAALGLMLLVAADRIMPRPELPTFVLLAGVLALLDRFERRGDAWIYAVPALQVVWANVHGLFALGIALCAMHLLAELLRPLTVPGGRVRPGRLRRLAAVTALAVLASLANPNGLDGALYPIEQLGMIGPPDERGPLGSLITELIPPLGGDSLERKPLSLLFLGALALGSFAAMSLNWRRLHGADPLAWVAFLYLALSAQRNVALFAIAAAPILVRNLNEVLDARPRRRPRAAAASALAASALLLWLAADAVGGRFYRRIGSYRQAGFDVMEVLYPIGAAEWIARERPSGPICHHMADGGYLIWRLHPDYPVMTDGRLEVYGADRFVELQVTGPERFRKLDAEYRFGVVLVPYSLIQSDQLMWWLYLNSNWRLAFVDDVSAVFERLTDLEAPRKLEVDVDRPDLFPALDGPPSTSDLVRRLARTNFYSSLKRYERALELWEGAMERYPDLSQSRIVHASLLQKSGLPAAAEAILRALLEERPGDAVLLTQVGDLRLEAGDREAARSLYDRALAEDPGLPYAAFRRAGVAELERDRDLAVQLYLRVLSRSHPASRLAIGAAGRLRVLGQSL